MKLKHLLFEYGLNTIVGDLLRSIISFIKKTKIDYDKSKKNKYSRKFNLFGTDPILFSAEVRVVRMNDLNRSNLYIKNLEDGYSISATSFPEEDEFILEIHLDPTKEPSSYTKIAGWIKDHLRHELEHIDQVQIQGKKINGPQKGYRYLISKVELPAMVKGMYSKAKYEKKYLDDVFNEYLDYVMQRGDIKSEKEKQLVFNVWITFAKKNLPNAKFRTT